MNDFLVIYGLGKRLPKMLAELEKSFYSTGTCIISLKSNKAQQILGLP